jgi:hypothetical protein
MIIEAREGVARAIDSGMTALYCSIDTRIRKDILQENWAEYGHEIVSSLGRQLSPEFGRGFSEKNLRHMIRFSEAFPQSRIVSALRRQLTWTHFKSLIYLEDPQVSIAKYEVQRESVFRQLVSKLNYQCLCLKLLFCIHY